MAIDELAMQKLRLLSSVSGELPYSAFFVVDEKLEYVLAGGEALAMTGYTPADFIGRRVCEMVPPASADQAKADYSSVFAGAPFVREHTVEGRDFESRGRLLQVEDDGGPDQRYALVVSYDVTERKQAEQRKDRFLAVLGHELRNPLAAVSTAIELLRRGASPGVAEHTHKIVGRQLAQISRLADELQDLAGIYHGQVKLRHARTRIDELVEEVVAGARASAEAKRQSMLLRLPGRAIEAWVDPVRLAQVLNNMLANSVKYTQVQGSIEVALAGDAGGFTIEVRDDGAGMAPAILAGVFELFNRGQPAVGQDDQGLGIGMWLAQQFVRDHGGSIVAASDGPGAGSCFTVWLPLGFPQDRPIASPQK